MFQALEKAKRKKKKKKKKKKVFSPLRSSLTRFRLSL
jgi:hypothetical protein